MNLRSLLRLSRRLWSGSKARCGRPEGRTILGLEALEPRDLLSGVPTISPIAKQFVNENTPLVVQFTVAETGVDPSTLTVSATSSNTTVIPNSGLVPGGGGANRTLTITPANNQLGVSILTLTVQDGNGGTNTEQVPVLVTTTETAPFSDNFNRPDNPFLGVGWNENVGDWSDKSSMGAANGSPLDLATVNGLSASDVAVSAQVSLSVGQGAGLVARYSGPGDQNMYFGALTDTGSGYLASILRNVNGVWTTLFVQSYSGSASGTLEFDAVGPSLRLFLNGQVVAYADDNALSGPGSAGVRTSTGVAIDNFSVFPSTLGSFGNLSSTYNDNFGTPGPNSQLNSATKDWLNEAGDFVDNGATATAVGGSAVTVNGQPLPNLNLAIVNGLSASNVAVQANVTLAPGQGAGLAARYSGPGDQNMYFGSVSDTGSGYLASILRNVNGVWTTLFVQSYSGSASGALRFEAVGPSLKLFLNNALIAYTDDNVLTAGSVGIRTSTGASLSNLTASVFTPTNPGLPFMDSFSTATNQQLSNTWLNQAGSFQVAGGVATAIGGGQVTVNGQPLPNFNLATVNGVAATNIIVQADVTVASGQGAGLITRYSGPGAQNFYLGAVTNTGSGVIASISSNVGGVWTTLKTASVGSGSGTLKFVVSGGALTLFLNNSQVLSVSDSALTGAGDVGILASTGAVFDNFSAM